jgi:uncharacterized membrane protein
MKSTHPDGVLRGRYGLTIRLLLLLAIGVSGHLLSVSLSGGTAIGCAPGSACDQVLNSRWAYVLGIPVSALALLVDGALLLITFSCGPKSSPRQRRKAWELMLPTAMLVIGGALWFIALQLVVVKLICPWCMTAHVAGATAAVMLLLRFPMKEAVERREKDPAVLRSTAMKLALAALVLFALFAVAQIVIAPKTFTMKNIPAATSTPANPSNAIAIQTTNTAVTNIVATKQIVTNSPVAAMPTPTNSPPPVAGMAKPFGVFGGLVTLDLAQVPVWGSPDAPHKLVSLFDYSCHHCALMHKRVADIANQFRSNLVVISLPMPLDRKCNPLITRTQRAHENACDYARIGLAVWRAKPAAIEGYDDWFFDVFNGPHSPLEQPQPPTVDAATKHAIEIVGDAAKFEAARRDPWIDQQIALSTAIFDASWKRYRNGNMPQFIIGTNLVSGTLETAQLKAIVEKYVSPPPPK